jgi:RHS repeat-associated protein
MVDTTGTTTYTYDDLYRLTDVTYPNSDVQTYDYDPMGNRTEKTHNSVPTTYSCDDADQMTLAGGVSYDYDDNGNQVASGSDTFDWDAENRLVETNIASVTGTYDYNGDGLRITRTIGGSGVSYVWDLNSSLPVVLEDTTGNRYVYGLDLLTRIDGTDDEWYLYDGLGSTTGLADDAGAVTGSYEYDVFGAERSHSGDATEWSYTGEQHDATGLEYLRARYYDPGTGRFLSRDPLSESPLWKGYLFGYASSNPTNLVDPSGLDSEDPEPIPLPEAGVGEDVDRCLEGWGRCQAMAGREWRRQPIDITTGKPYLPMRPYLDICTKYYLDCRDRATDGTNRRASFNMRGARTAMRRMTVLDEGGFFDWLPRPPSLPILRFPETGSGGLLGRGSKEGGFRPWCDLSAILP